MNRKSKVSLKKRKLNWVLVAGARPNFMKIAPLLRSIKRYNLRGQCKIIPFLVHSGQHYDESMSGRFFKDLLLPEPDAYLGVGSGTHAEQTGKVLIEFEKILLRETPDLVIVVGDVNSTLAGALAAAKLHIPVAHVEAGLRSYDRLMPEEINRIVTDVLSDFLFTPSLDGNVNLMKEGIDPAKIFFVGDIMVDSLLFYKERAKKLNIAKRLGLFEVTFLSRSSAKSATQRRRDREFNTRPYAVLTLHRPSNVDYRGSFYKIIQGLLKVSSWIPIIFPIHPRTRKQIEKFEFQDHFEMHPSLYMRPQDYYDGNQLKRKIHCFDPLGYLEFMNLMMNAKVVLTDSGGIQEETTVLNIPCITLRDSTERPITLVHGTNTLVHNNPQQMVRAVQKVLNGDIQKVKFPPFWDGRTAERVVNILVKKSKNNGKRSQ
jgi:UDP-N-acetylglucosamine 2-epimerase (non-hydrolysing)